MKTIVSGSTGLIGSALVPFLKDRGFQVARLVRSPSDFPEEQIRWDPERDAIDAGALEGFDAVVHLAGENVGQGRWTRAKKKRILESRVRGTTVLSEALASLETPPKVLVAASAVGFYGNRADAVLTEEEPPGNDFLARVCVEWEGAARPASDKGVRVVNLRFGVVLSASGGALAKMRAPFKLGLGGVVGNGRQYLSWIALDDALGAVLHALKTHTLRGPVNAAAPAPVTNREFTKALGKALSRPAVVPLPAFAARIALGEMADALLLSSARAAPKKLLDSGFDFRYPNLEECLRNLLGKQR